MINGRNPTAEVALLYYNGWGVAQDYAKAREWFEEALRKAMRTPRHSSGADAQAQMPVLPQSDPAHRARGCSLLLGRECAQHSAAIAELVKCFGGRLGLAGLYRSRRPS